MKVTFKKFPKHYHQSLSIMALFEIYIQLEKCPTVNFMLEKYSHVIAHFLHDQAWTVEVPISISISGKISKKVSF